MGALASGIMWDRGDVGATDVGSVRLMHDTNMRAKHKGGVAMDNGARGAGGMVVDGSGAEGMQQLGRDGYDSKGIWGTMVEAHGV